MVIEVNALGWKGPHVAYACGQPIGRSLSPRTQHHLAAQAKAARNTASMAYSARTAARDARQQSVPSETAFAHAGPLLAAWQEGSQSSSGNRTQTTREKKDVQTPKATPALDAYKASQSRDVPRYISSAEHARIRALKEEEKQLVEEIRAIDRSQQRRQARHKLPV